MTHQSGYERQKRRWWSSTALSRGLPATPASAKKARRTKADDLGGKLLFDALEPRFLLNGEILLVNDSVGAVATQNHAFLIETVSQTTTAQTAPASQVEIIDQTSHVVIAQAPLTSVSKIEIDGGSAKDALTVDAASFGSAKAPPIIFAGGAGVNQLTITGNGSQTWSVTGANAGKVSGLANVSFTGVGNLIGGANVNDTFVIGPKGSLTGGVDGGGGGYDSLAFQGVNAKSVTFDSTGPHSGSVTIDGAVTNYAGLQPVSVSGTIADVIVNAPAANDQTILETDPSDPASLTFLSQNHLLESASFTAPTHSLTVNLTGADDSLAIDNFASTSGASLTVNATAGGGSVDVTSGAVVSTRNTGGGDPASAASQGNSGNVAINAQTISVDAGAKLLAFADSGYTPGSVSLSASATGVGAANEAASVALHGGTVEAGTLSMTAAVSQTASVSASQIANASFTNAATATVDGSSLIQTSGAVLIEANSAAGAGVTATAAALPATNVDADFALANVTNDAAASVGGAAVVTAGGDVDVVANNIVLVEISGDGTTGGASAGGASVGLGLITTNTTATLGGGAQVSAAGNLLVGANSSALVNNVAKATAQGATANTPGTQQVMNSNGAKTADGPVAVASSLAVTHLSQTTQATANTTGPIAATGAFSVEVGSSSTVHTRSDASAIDGGKGVGAAVAINAINVVDQASLAGATSITAPSVTVTSGTLPGTTDTFTVAALSGAGASPVGVAGALAINDVGDASQASVGQNAALALSGSNVLIGAGEATSASASAGPGQSVFGPPDGIGASVAVNAVTTDTDAGVLQGATLTGAGSLLVTALAAHTTSTEADAGAAGGTATAAAVALTNVSDTAAAHLDADSAVTASGAVGLDAGQSSTSTTNATGIVAGELTAVGAVAALGVLDGETSATSEGDVTAGGKVGLLAAGNVVTTVAATAGTLGADAGEANANSLIDNQLGYLGLPTTLAPSASTVDGAVGVAAALGVGYTHEAVSAEQTAGVILAGDALSLTATGEALGVTTADAINVDSTLPGSGIAAAVAINVGAETILADIEGAVTAPGVSLEAGPVQPGAGFGALALSGAGGSQVGVAGAFALNDVTTSSNATIDSGAQVDAGGLGVTVDAGNLNNDVAGALAQLTASSPIGVGASTAINLVNTSVDATVNGGASIKHASYVHLLAVGGAAETTNAVGGAGGGTATAASTALTYAQGTVTANVATGAKIATSGAVTIEADGADAAKTTASVVADGVNTAVGAALAFGVVVDGIAATSAGAIKAGGAVRLEAAGGLGNGVGATASLRGAKAGGAGANAVIAGELGQLGLPASEIPGAATADGAVGVAAALGIGYTSETVSAQQTGGSITAGGALTLVAGGTATGATVANASPVDPSLPGVGVGAAVAINVGVENLVTDIDGTADAVGVTLTTTPVQPNASFSALAYSGAGAKNVGVAGALALNVATTQAQATLDSAAKIDAGGGAVSVSASNDSLNTVDAFSQVTAKSPVGVGASVAVNIVNASVSASQVHGATLTDAGDVTFHATGDDAAVTAALGGAAGGTATAASVALTYAQDSVTAQLQNGASINSSGAVGFAAGHTGTTATTATGQTVGANIGVGAALAIGIARDTTLADVSGALTAQGAVSVFATAQTYNAAASTAAAVGANAAGVTTPAQLGSQLTYLGNPPGALLPAVQTPDGAIGVTAAVAVGVTLGSVTASQSAGQITTPAGVSLRATGGAQGSADASAQAVNGQLKQTGIGGAVAVDVGVEKIQANVNATIHSTGLTVFAGPSRESVPQFTATATSGQSRAPVTIAGALAINVADTDTQAELGSTAVADVGGGDVTVTADGGSLTNATATSQPSSSAAVGLGASVAVNVVFDTTLAGVEGAAVNKANNVTLTASSDSTATSGALAGTQALDASAAAIAVNFADRNTTAEVTAGPQLNLLGTLTINASETGSATSLADASGLGAADGLGAALDVNVPLDNVTAKLARNVSAGADVAITATSQTGAGAGALAGAVGAPNGTSANSVIASVVNYLNNGPAASNAPGFPDLAGTVASAAGLVGLTLPSFSAAASISANASIADTQASIANGVTVLAKGLVTVTATGLNDAGSLATSFALQSAGDVGLALGADLAERTIKASIGQNATVKANAIAVLADVGAPDQTPTLLSEADAASFANGAAAGAAASIALDLVLDKTVATVGAGATLVGQTGVGVAAIGSMTGIAKSGATVNSAAAGLGVALAANIVDDQTQAFVDANANIDSPGIILVSAFETQILGTAAQSGGGGGDATVPASISLNVLLANTHAYTSAGDALNQAGLTPTASQQIFIDANDATFITGNAGVLGGVGAEFRPGGAQAGAAADFGFTDKTTQADLNGTASAAGNIIVNSASSQLIASHAQSDGFGFLVSIAGSGAAQMETITTNALIDANAVVNAGDNVVILAHDSNSVGAIADAHSDADALTAGAGIAAIASVEITNAYVGANARVNADANGAPVLVDDGQFFLSYSPASTAPGQVGRSYLPGDLTDAFNVIFTNPLYVVATSLLGSIVSFLDVSPINTMPEDPAGSQTRTATPTQTSISGLAVTALSQDDLETSGSGYGAAVGASPELSGAGVDSAGATSAFIGAGAKINLDGAHASKTQTALVAAGTDTFALSLAGTTSLAGYGAVGPASTLDIIQPITQAYIGAGAHVASSTNIFVLANANEDAIGVATGISAGGLASLAGSLPVVSIATSTFAYIDKNAVVAAPDSILVYANDTTSTEPVAGVLTAAGAATFGASVAVTLIGKDTQAWIGAGAQVDAGGFGGGTLDRGQGGVIAIDPDTSSSPLTTINGLSVLATSSEQVEDLAVAGTVSLIAGIAGSVSVELIANTTAAHVDANAKINASGAAASATQTVAVGAYDDTGTIAADAGLEANLVAEIGGGADLQVIRNTTLAYVAQGAVIDAAQDVNIVGRSEEFAQSFVGGVGVSGLVGINGSVSAVSIGAVIGGSLLDALSSLSGPGTLQGTVDNTIASLITQGGDSLIKVLNQYAQGVGGSQPAAAAMTVSAPNAPVTTDVAAGVVNAGTGAAVVGATINAGRDVNVKALDDVQAALDTSFTYNFSLFSSPLSIAIDLGILAGRANASAGIGQNAVITAGRDINVQSDADTSQRVQSANASNSSADNSQALVDNSTLKTPNGDVNVTANGDTATAYSAILPGFSGFKERISYNKLRNTINAAIQDNANVTASGKVNVVATDDVTVTVIANGATLFGSGFLDFALAGSLAWNDVADTVSAGISQSTVNANSVLVSATETPTLTSIALGIVVSSNLSIGGGSAVNLIDNAVHAYVNNGATVTAAGAVQVEALDQLGLKALAGAAAAFSKVSVGAAFTYNIINDSITAEINGATVASTGGQVIVAAATTGEVESAAVGIAEADSVTGDGSVPINTSSMTITAEIVNSKVTGYSGVGVGAEDNSAVKALAGSVAVSIGAFAAGAAVADNTMTDKTEALVSNSTVTSSHGGVIVTAIGTPEIDVLAAGAAGANSVALAGSVSINHVNETVEALVNAGSTLKANSIEITAFDTPVIKSITGALGIGIGVAAVSGSVSDNYVSDTTVAEDDNSALTAQSVTVKALSNPQIFALAAAGSASGVVSAEGAVTLNQVSSTTLAEITGTGAVVTASAVTVMAQDEAGNDNDPGIQSIAAGISLGSTVGVGGSFAYNTISDDVGAIIGGKAKIKATTVTVASTDDPDIEVLAGAVGAGGTVAVDGSLALNTITDINAALVDNATIAATTANVTAMSSPLIESLAVVGGVSGTVSVVASVTTNTIHSQTIADVLGNSSVSLGSGALNVTATDDSTIKSLSGSASGSGTFGLAAAFAFNTVDSSGSTPSSVLAAVSNSTVTAGAVSVAATFGANLLGIAISGSGAGVVGFGGSGVSNIAETTTDATVQNASITLSGTLSVTATDSSDVSGLAANADGAGVVSGGAAVVVNRIGDVTQAQVLGGVAKVGAVTVLASATGTDESLAVSGAGAATAVGVFDDTENIVYDTVEAVIGANASVVTTGAVTLTATDSGTIKSLAGSAAGASAFAGTGAHAQNDIGATDSSRPSDILASIQDGASVSAGSVALNASFTGNIQSLAIGVSGAAGVSGDASIVDSVIDQPIGAQIVGSATKVTSVGAVTLTTVDSSKITAIAGAAEGAGIVAAGASITTSTINDAASASISSAKVTTTGKGSDVSLDAESSGAIEVAALSIGGAAIASIQGAVDNNTMGSTTDAAISGGAQVTAGRSVLATAGNHATIKSLAASVAGAGGAGIAGAVANNQIENQTEAYVTGSTVTAKAGGVSIEAVADGNIQSLSAGVGGGFLGVSGGVSINQIEQTIEAYVDVNSVVTANGAINIQARDTATIKSLAGQAAGGFVGVGGAVAYNDIADTVEAYAQDGSKLSASGNISLSALASSQIDTVAVGVSAGVVGAAGSVAVANIGDDVWAYTDNATVTTPDNVVITAVTTDSPNIWAGSLGAGFVGVAGTVAVETTGTYTSAYTHGGTITALGTGATSVAPVMDGATGAISNTNAVGLIITAINTETPSLLSGTAAGGAVGVAGNVSVIKVENSTDAYIGGSIINSPSQPGAAAIVRAFQSTNINTLGGAAAAGIVGAAGAVTVINVENFTTASITESILTGAPERQETPSAVTAKYVEVTARGYETVTDGVIGVAGGLVGVAGSVSYVAVQDTTTARIVMSVVDAIGGVGAIEVNASDNTSISPTTGAVAGGFVGVSAGVSVNSIENQTEANLIGAQLNATGAITVDAANTASIDSETVAGSGGAVGIGAAVAVNTIQSITEANLQTNTFGGTSPTLINQDPRFRSNGAFGVGAGQTVAVSTTDNASINSNEGALGAGLFGAAGAAIDVDSINDHVVTEAQVGTQISAAGNVSLTSSSDRTASTNPLSFSAGIVAIDGSITVINLGADLSSAAAAQFPSSTRSQVNSSLTPTMQGVNTNDGDAADAADQGIGSANPQGVDGVLDPNAKNDSETAVILDSSEGGSVDIGAGGSLTISASNTYNVQVNAGSAAGGVAGFGLAGAFVSITDNTLVNIGDKAELSAGGNMNIGVSDTANGRSLIQVYAGQAALLDVGGSVADVSLNLNVGASVGNDASLFAGGVVSVTANQTSDISAQGLNFSFGVGSVGAVVTDVVVQGDVEATLGDNVFMGGGEDRIGGLQVTATADNIAQALTDATSGGVLTAGQLNSANVDVTPDITAQTGADDSIFANGAIGVNAASSGGASASAQGTSISGLGSLGESYAEADLTPVATAQIGSDDTLDTLGAVTVSASQLIDGPTHQVSADAQAGGGAGGISGNGAEALVNVSGQAFATVQSQVHISAGGVVSALTTVGNAGNAQATGGNIGGIAADGGTHAEVDDNGKSEAIFDSNVTVTQSGGLDISAASADFGTAYTDASAGGLVALNGNAPDGAGSYVTLAPTVTAALGAADLVMASGDADISAIDLAAGATDGEGGSFGGVNVGESVGSTTINPTVTTTVGSGATLSAGGNVNITARQGGSSGVINGVNLSVYDATAQTTAQANGSGGSLIGGGTSTQSTISVTGALSATIDAGAHVSAGQNAAVGTSFTINTNATGGSGSGSGGISVGSTNSQTTIKLTNLAEVQASASLVAGGDATVSSASSFNDDGDSTSNGGGGLGSGSSATTVVQILQSTQTQIDSNATITSGNNINVTATSSYVGSVSAEAGSGAGGGSSAKANAVYEVGDPSSSHQDPTSVSVAAGAVLTAPNTVNLSAIVQRWNAYGSASSTSGAVFGAYAAATVELDLLSLAQVNVAGQVTGDAAINILAEHLGLSASDNVSSDAIAIFPVNDSTLNSDQAAWSVIGVAPGATLRTHALTVNAVVQVLNSPVNDGSINFNLNFDWRRQITFDGTAIILSGDPTLTIASDGTVTNHDGVNYVITDGQIDVGPITNSGTGTVTFETSAAQYVSSPGATPTEIPSLIQGSKGAIVFVDTLASVDINNASTMPLILNGINPLDADNDAAVKLVGDNTPINFSVGVEFNPTQITVNSQSSVTLEGVIDNPIGDTSITSVGGAVLAGAGAQIVSETVEINANGDIGSLSQPLAITLVEGVGTAGLTLTAGQNVYLDLTGDLRSASNYPIAVGNASVTAGGDIDITLESGLYQGTTSGSPYGVTVGATHSTGGTTTKTHVYNHYHIDTGSPTPLPIGVFATGGVAAPATYTFDMLNAGGNINVSDPGVSIGFVATTQLTGTGAVNVNVSGDVQITEAVGALTVGSIVSTGGSVTLASLTGSIVAGGPSSQVVGQGITLSAPQGGIGAADLPLAITLMGGGALSASAAGGIFITETTGDMRLDEVDSVSGDVSLATNNGAILDATGHSQINVSGVSITLDAKGGSIGTRSDHLTAHSSLGRTGVHATATGGVYLDASHAHSPLRHGVEAMLYDEVSGAFVSQSPTASTQTRVDEAGMDWIVDASPAAKGAGELIDWASAA